VSTKTQFERQKELARLKRLRQESFMLNPPSKSITETTLNGRLRTISDIKRDFQLGDIIEFVHRGIEVILVYKLKLYFS